MYCIKNITDDLFWVGANDRRLHMFEGVYSVPKGISYNSYLLLDEKTVLFDTVDKAVDKVFFENLQQLLNGRKLDYLVIHHMEPDHSGTIAGLFLRYPDVTVVCNAKTQAMLHQFFDFDFDINRHIMLVKEGDTLQSGRHSFQFFMAPMVHWPEVMVTYDTVDKILFTADAFGTFGATNGAIFADEVDFMGEYMDEARRYYTNIVGKYGSQVQALLKKAANLELKMLCPLHGFVWRRDLNVFIDKYNKWSSYTPEDSGVMIAYASIYGNTENAAEIISARLRDRGIGTVLFDVSVTPASEIIAAAFRYSHLLFASATYNMEIFVTMDALLQDLAAHNIANRTVALIQNGSWAPASGKLMRERLASLKNITFLEPLLDIRSALKPSQEAEIDALVEAIAGTISPVGEERTAELGIDSAAFQKISYGLYVLSARENGRDNACIIDTLSQVSESPHLVSITVNKGNYTHDMILRTGIFNASVLTENAAFSTFKHFGYQSGREVNKFEAEPLRSANGLAYIGENTNAYVSARVVFTKDCGTHTLFLAEVTEAVTLSDAASATYAFYHGHIKEKPTAQEEKKRGYICNICGYFHEGDELPEDFICPICKRGASDFTRVE